MKRFICFSILLLILCIPNFALALADITVNTHGNNTIMSRGFISQESDGKIIGNFDISKLTKFNVKVEKNDVTAASVWYYVETDPSIQVLYKPKGQNEYFNIDVTGHGYTSGFPLASDSFDVYINATEVGTHKLVFEVLDTETDYIYAAYTVLLDVIPGAPDTSESPETSDGSFILYGVFICFFGAGYLVIIMRERGYIG